MKSIIYLVKRCLEQTLEATAVQADHNCTNRWVPPSDHLDELRSESEIYMRLNYKYSVRLNLCKADKVQKPY